MSRLHKLYAVFVIVTFVIFRAIGEPLPLIGMVTYILIACVLFLMLLLEIAKN